MLISCSKEAGEIPPPENGFEINVLANVITSDESKAPVDVTKSLELQFLRADETASGTYGAYGTTALPATRTAGSGAQVIAFTTKQYYMLNGLNTKLAGYYPAATSYAGGVVSWTFDGTKDILTAPAQAGNYTNAMPGFTFGHRLTQLQFFPYATDADAATLWGKVTKIAIAGQRTTCTFTPASADAAGTVAFTGATSALSVAGATAAAPGVGTAAAACFGDPMMVEPQAGSYELTVTVTTEKGERTMKVPARTYPAGVATKVYLKLTAYSIEPTAEITAWADAGSGTGDGEDNFDPELWAYTTLYYGSALHHGSVTTGLSGSVTTSYNSYTASSNGTKFGKDAAATAYATEKPFYRLQVANENAGTNITWLNAWAVCSNKTTDGGGWRLPRLSEVKLMYNNRDLLNAQPLFEPLTGFQWSATETSTWSDCAFAVDFSNGNAAVWGKHNHYYSLRCVREAPADAISANDCYQVLPLDTARTADPVVCR